MVALTPALSHPMGGGERAPAIGVVLCPGRFDGFAAKSWQLRNDLTANQIFLFWVDGVEHVGFDVVHQLFVLLPARYVWVWESGELVGVGVARFCLYAGGVAV